MKRLTIFCCLSIIQLGLWAQEPVNAQVEDDMGIVEDRFQELFFEALKQKAIENYDRAIEALLEAQKMRPDLPEIQFELGKNYKFQGSYDEAVTALNKALEMKPEDEWILDELYDVYVKQDDTENAMAVVKQLVDIHPDYKQDLATLYIKQGEFKLALELLDELDKQFGPNEVRSAMRSEVYNISGDDHGRIDHLILRIKANPKNEENYLNLIYRYSEKGMEKEAYEVTQQLLEEVPDSELAHLALYKFAWSKQEYAVALNSMKIVLKSPQIDSKTKTLVLNDFVELVKLKPEFEEDLIEVTSQVSSDSRSNIELGYYYLQNGDKVKALESLTKALAENPDDYDLIKNILLLQVDLENYEEVVRQSAEALESFPAQPILYLLNGVANNRIGEPNAAIENLEMGLEYLIEDPAMEIDFYKELSLAHKQKNNIKKIKNYYVYCRSGGRSGQACMIMGSLGFENTYNLLGGMMEWEGETI